MNAFIRSLKNPSVLCLITPEIPKMVQFYDTRYPTLGVLIPFYDKKCEERQFHNKRHSITCSHIWHIDSINWIHNQ